jgi:hypothetical protein
MDFWLPDLEKAIWAFAREQGNLLAYVAKVVGSYGNIIFYFTNGEKWVYVPETDEIIKTEGDWR